MITKPLSVAFITLDVAFELSHLDFSNDMDKWLSLKSEFKTNIYQQFQKSLQPCEHTAYVQITIYLVLFQWSFDTFKYESTFSTILFSWK